MEEKKQELLQGSIVLCKTTKVLDYGVFAEIIGYKDLHGFVHISEIAPTWVKNIRNFVKEGQMRAAKVVSIHNEKNQVDLSFSKVSEGEEKRILEEYKQESRNDRIVELIARQKKQSVETVRKKIELPLIEKYGSLQNAFQEVVQNQEKALEGIIEKESMALVIEIVSKLQKKSEKIVIGTISLSTSDSMGIEKIKEALLKARDSVKNARCEITYVGNGKYLAKVSSDNYKTSEKELKQAAETAISIIKKSNGNGSFAKT